MHFCRRKFHHSRSTMVLHYNSAAFQLKGNTKWQADTNMHIPLTEMKSYRFSLFKLHYGFVDFTRSNADEKWNAQDSTQLMFSPMLLVDFIDSKNVPVTKRNSITLFSSHSLEFTLSVSLLICYTTILHINSSLSVVEFFLV